MSVLEGAQCHSRPPRHAGSPALTRPSWPGRGSRSTPSGNMTSMMSDMQIRPPPIISSKCQFGRGCCFAVLSASRSRLVELGGQTGFPPMHEHPADVMRQRPPQRAHRTAEKKNVIPDAFENVHGADANDPPQHPAGAQTLQVRSTVKAAERHQRVVDERGAIGPVRRARAHDG